MSKRLFFYILIVLMLLLSIISLWTAISSLSSYINYIRIFLYDTGFFSKEFVPVLFLLSTNVLTPICLAILSGLLLFRREGYKLIFLTRENFTEYNERRKQNKKAKLEKQRIRLKAKLNKIDERQSDK